MRWFRRLFPRRRREARAWCLACCMWLWTEQDADTCRARGHNLM